MGPQTNVTHLSQQMQFVKVKIAEFDLNDFCVHVVCVIDFTSSILQKLWSISLLVLEAH